MAFNDFECVVETGPNGVVCVRFSTRPPDRAKGRMYRIGMVYDRDSYTWSGTRHSAEEVYGFLKEDLREEDGSCPWTLHLARYDG